MYLGAKLRTFYRLTMDLLKNNFLKKLNVKTGLFLGVEKYTCNMYLRTRARTVWKYSPKNFFKKVLIYFVGKK